jgi:hypothetical protein
MKLNRNNKSEKFPEWLTIVIVLLCIAFFVYLLLYPTSLLRSSQSHDNGIWNH